MDNSNAFPRMESLGVFATWSNTGKSRSGFKIGTQLYLDIQDTLGEEIAQPLKELQDHLRYAKVALKNFKDTNAGVDNYDPAGRARANLPISHLQDRLNRYTIYVERNIFGATLRLVDNHPYLSTLVRKAHPLLSVHPWGCGILQYDVVLDRHAWGLQLEWATGFIRPMVYLYAACRLLGKDLPAWPDMELLILRQRPKRLFYDNKRQPITKTAINTLSGHVVFQQPWRPTSGI